MENQPTEVRPIHPPTSSYPHIPNDLQLKHYPQGWTNVPQDIYSSDWDGEESDGQQFVRGIGLPYARPILVMDVDGIVIFEAGDKFYIANQISLNCFEIVSPSSEAGIFEGIEGDVGAKAFELREVC